MYRNFLMEDFLSSAPGSDTRPAMAKSITPEVTKCVEAAMAIARMASEIQDDKSYNGCYWVCAGRQMPVLMRQTSAYFTFCAIAVLLVYLMIYGSSADTSAIVAILDPALRGHKRMTWATTSEWQSLLEVGDSLLPHPR